MINRITWWFDRVFVLLEYKISQDKHILDTYMRRIRTLQPLTKYEWEDMRRLAEKEKRVMNPQRPGFEHIFLKGKDVVTGATLEPDAQS